MAEVGGVRPASRLEETSLLTCTRTEDWCVIEHYHLNKIFIIKKIS
jgi:hypothetical protein